MQRLLDKWERDRNKLIKLFYENERTREYNRARIQQLTICIEDLKSERLKLEDGKVFKVSRI